MKSIVLFFGIAFACTVSCASTAAGKQQAAAKPHAADAQQEVAMDDLGKYIGKRIVVHTKLNTTRSGVLTRRSITEVDLKVDSGAELTIPVNSIRRVTAPIGPPDPLFQKTDAQKADAQKADSPKPQSPKPNPQESVPQQPGDSSAKKN